MKKIFFIFLFLLFSIFLISCSNNVNNEKNIFVGKNGNWFVDGYDTNIKARTEDGRETIFRIQNGVIEWKYSDSDDWNVLVIVESGVIQDEYTSGLILNEVTGKGYMVMGYDGDEKEIVIPATYRGLEVFKIGDNAFAGTDIRKIKIGKNIICLGDYCFEGSQIVDVEFAEGSKLEEIGDGAFYNCDYLKRINIPNTLKKLGRCAFFLNDSLICEYDDVYGVKYLGSKENPFLICYDTSGTSIKSCVINKNCRFVNDYSFTYCSDLESVKIPEGVLSIGDSAFYSTGIKKVFIPSTVNYIGDATFNCSDDIEEMIVHEENKFYDSRNNCNGIIEKERNSLIYGCKNTVIPNDVKEIRDKAFYGISTLESIYIPASVTKIGIYVFSMCLNLSKMEVDKDNKMFTSRDSKGNNYNLIIKKGSYSQTLIYGGCDEEGELIIPEGVNYIDKEAFRGRLLLVEITLPKSLYSIYDYAFDYCNNLITINNASNLELEAGSNEHGGIAKKATTINKI